jgi:predicted transcriptional regulator
MAYVSTIPKSPVVAGITVGSVKHKLLLALRPGGAYFSQLKERFAVDVSHPLHRMCNEGLLAASGDHDGRYYRLTDKGRELVRQDGPLARKTLNTYCQL